MTPTAIDAPTRTAARVAGLLYVLMVLPAPFSLIYIPAKLFVKGNPTATANNVLAHETLFHAGIFGELFNGVAFIFLVMALYGLLGRVSKMQASLMVSLVLISVAIGFVNVVNNIAALTLFRGADFLAAFDQTQRDALGMLFLRLHSQTNYVNEIFWGLWLLPFGILVMRSVFIPRILGILLIVNGFAYVVASLTSLFFPSYANVVSLAILPALLGELWIMLWLLIKGVKLQRPVPLTAW